MAKSVFISYNHKQGPWVTRRLLPILRAGGCEVFIDRERFSGGYGVQSQMDTWQDKAETSLLVISAEYLASPNCCHEMERAIGADPDFKFGKVLPVIRDKAGKEAIMGLSLKRWNASCQNWKEREEVASGGSDLPLWVDLINDRDGGSWDLLLNSLEAGELRTTAPHWLDVRDEIACKIGDQKVSVNLVVRGEPNWRALRDHLKQEWIPRLGIVNLDNPATITRKGLVREILVACGETSCIHPPPRDLEALNGLLNRSEPARLALLHFENIRVRGAYGVELFHTLRHLLERRKLVLMVESRIPFRDLVPHDHPLSNLYLDLIELKGLEK